MADSEPRLYVLSFPALEALDARRLSELRGKYAGREARLLGPHITLVLVYDLPVDHAEDHYLMRDLVVRK